MIVRYMRAIRYAIPFSKLYRDTDTDRDRVSVSVSGYKLYPIPTSLVGAQEAVEMNKFKLETE